ASNTGPPPIYPRGRLQARAHGGGPTRAKDFEQRVWHLEHGAGGAGVRCQPFRADFHRQGRAPDQHHGRHQTCGRDGAASNCSVAPSAFPAACRQLTRLDLPHPPVDGALLAMYWGS
ncbi:hypothetical protein BCSJ1_26513, partial [Bacillus cereus SJ1]